jgi:hypothetical protein
LEAYSGLDASPWNLLASAPLPKSCPSLVYQQSVTGVLTCSVDHVGTGAVEHCALVNVHHVTWSDTQSAASWANASRCAHSHCGQVVFDGLPYCSPWCAYRDKHTTIEHVSDEEAAA